MIMAPRQSDLKFGNLEENNSNTEQPQQDEPQQKLSPPSKTRIVEEETLKINTCLSSISSVSSCSKGSKLAAANPKSSDSNIMQRKNGGHWTTTEEHKAALPVNGNTNKKWKNVADKVRTQEPEQIAIRNAKSLSKANAPRTEKTGTSSIARNRKRKRRTIWDSDTYNPAGCSTTTCVPKSKIKKPSSFRKRSSSLLSMHDRLARLHDDTDSSEKTNDATPSVDGRALLEAGAGTHVVVGLPNNLPVKYKRAVIPHHRSSAGTIWRRMSKDNDEQQGVGGAASSFMRACLEYFKSSSSSHRYDFEVVYRIATAKLVAGMHNSAFKLCHDTLSSWYEKARHVLMSANMNQIHEIDTLKVMDSLRVGLAGTWCVYATLLLQLSQKEAVATKDVITTPPRSRNDKLQRRRTRKPKRFQSFQVRSTLFHDDTEIGQPPLRDNDDANKRGVEYSSIIVEPVNDNASDSSSIIEYASAVINFALGCPIVGNHPWIILMGSKILFDNNKNQRDGIRAMQRIQEAINICKRGIHLSSNPLAYVSGELCGALKSSRMGTECCNNVSFPKLPCPPEVIVDDDVSHDSLLESLDKLKLAMQNTRPVMDESSQQQQYLFVEKMGPRILCDEVNRLSRLKEQMEKSLNHDSPESNEKNDTPLLSLRAETPKTTKLKDPYPDKELEKCNNCFLASQRNTASEAARPIGHHHITKSRAIVDEENWSQSTPPLIAVDHDEEDGKNEKDPKIVKVLPSGCAKLACSSKDERYHVQDHSSTMKSRVMELEYVPNQDPIIESHVESCMDKECNNAVIDLEHVPNQEPSNLALVECCIDKESNSNAGANNSRVMDLEYVPNHEPFNFVRVESCSDEDNKAGRKSTNTDFMLTSFDPNEGRGHTDQELIDLLDYALEAFGVEQADIINLQATGAGTLCNEFNPKSPHFSGQVGLRCLFCRDHRQGQFGVAGSFRFPRSRQTVHRDAWLLCLQHLDGCTRMPRMVRFRYQEFREKISMDSGDVQDYWARTGLSIRNRERGEGVKWRRLSGMHAS